MFLCEEILSIHMFCGDKIEMKSRLISLRQKELLLVLARNLWLKKEVVKPVWVIR